MSIKQDTILADYGNEELLNESADVEWVNKVRKFSNNLNLLIFILKTHSSFPAMGSTSYEILCTSILILRMSKYTENI